MTTAKSSTKDRKAPKSRRRTGKSSGRKPQGRGPKVKQKVEKTLADTTSESKHQRSSTTKTHPRPSRAAAAHAALKIQKVQARESTVPTRRAFQKTVDRAYNDDRGIDTGDHRVEKFNEHGAKFVLEEDSKGDVVSTDKDNQWVNDEGDIVYNQYDTVDGKPMVRAHKKTR